MRSFVWDASVDRHQIRLLNGVVGRLHVNQRTGHAIGQRLRLQEVQNDSQHTRS